MANQESPFPQITLNATERLASPPAQVSPDKSNKSKVANGRWATSPTAVTDCVGEYEQLNGRLIVSPEEEDATSNGHSGFEVIPAASSGLFITVSSAKFIV